MPSDIRYALFNWLHVTGLETGSGLLTAFVEHLQIVIISNCSTEANSLYSSKPSA
jgi:hypothetical protein